MADTPTKIAIDGPEADSRFMGLALAQARQAARQGEVPIGAVIVCNGRVIGEGHNISFGTANRFSADAEILAITAAENSLGGKYLTDCTLYVTVEPCLMCAGAIGWSQLRRIVIGAPDPKRGYSTATCKSPFHPKAQVVSGVRAAECSALVTAFFRSKR